MIPYCPLAAISAPVLSPAARITRDISEHHAECAACKRFREGGGKVAYGPGGVRRVRCRQEVALFAALWRAS